VVDKDKQVGDHNEDIDKVLRGEAKPTDPDIDTRLPEDPSRRIDEVRGDRDDDKK